MIQNFAKPNNMPKVLALTGILSAAGSSYLITPHKKTQMLSLETEFGTVDGHFPTATKGALLSNPPGNKDHIVGERYVALSQRKSSERRDMDQKYRHN